MSYSGTPVSEVRSASNGVIRIGRKGLKKFAFGDGPVFEVDVVVAFQQFLVIDDSFRAEEDAEGRRSIPLERMQDYHQEIVAFVSSLEGTPNASLTVAEALDFLARLREQYEEVATFFRPKSSDEQESPDTSQQALHFSEEPAS